MYVIPTYSCRIRYKDIIIIIIIIEKVRLRDEVKVQSVLPRQLHDQHYEFIQEESTMPRTNTGTAYK